MKHLIVISILLIMFAVPSFAQDQSEEVTLPDDVMKQVIHDIVKSTIKSSKDHELIYFAKKGLSADWLPKIRNVDFVLLGKDPVKGYGQDVYFWQNLRKEKGSFVTDFGSGRSDNSSRGGTWSFRLVNSRVKDLRAIGRWGSDS